MIEQMVPFLENVLLSLEYSRTESYGEQIAGSHRIPLSVFSSPILFDSDYDIRHGETLVFADANLCDLSSPLDFCYLQKPLDSGLIFQAHRFREVALKQCRGLVWPVPTKIVQQQSMFMGKNHRFITFKMHFTQRSNGEWVKIDKQQFKQIDSFRGYSEVGFRQQGAERLSEYEQRRMGVVIGAQFSSEFDWHVAIGISGSVQLLVPTDPKGAMRAFKDRDVPEGRKKRASLIHWVREHYRRCKNSNPDDEVFAMVKQHLRGAFSFSWAGFDCRVFPSKSDLRVFHNIHGKQHALAVAK